MYNPHTYCVDDLIEVEEHSCVTLCTTNKPKAITKSSYDTLRGEWREEGEGSGLNREMRRKGECMDRVEAKSGGKEWGKEWGKKEEENEGREERTLV